MPDNKEKIRRIYEALPQLNCGLCGFESCGKFARGVVEGKASPFGCRQDPWAGYRINQIIGSGEAGLGSIPKSNQGLAGSSQAVPASLGGLRAEVDALSKGIEGILERINRIERKEAIIMPRGDGTGPAGRGPGTGRGLGQGAGRGRMGGRSAGLGGECVCPNCGHRITHQRGTPCSQIRCPNCGAMMTR